MTLTQWAKLRCANYTSSGGCLKFAGGEGARCAIARGHSCNYFAKAVLPACPELTAAYAEMVECEQEEESFQSVENPEPIL